LRARSVRTRGTSEAAHAFFAICASACIAAM
jgi:hypothetical protein